MNESPKDQPVKLKDVEIRILTNVLLDRAARAREDIFEFFNFVMRDFTDSNKRIKVMPHQRVGLEFIMAHDRCVNMWPVGTAKTFTMAGLTLFLLGRSPNLRGAIVSATEAQAGKIVQLVRDYIEQSAELKLVFPHLKRGTREGEPWTQTAITVARPPGIKDASLTAYGVDSPRIIGSRLNWVIIDDVLNGENTATKEQRDKVKYLLDSAILSRLDPVGAKVVFTNTPWHPDDAVTHAARPTKAEPPGRGWASMRMDIYGDIEIFDDDETFDPQSSNFEKFFESEHLREANPKDKTSAVCRLVDHDPDPKNEKPLWPEKYPVEWIERQRGGKLPHVFNQLYRCIVRDDASAMCKQEYIDLCLLKARQLGIYSLTSEYKGSNLTFTGVDLAISPGEEHDDTVLFTFEARPDGLNVILDIEIRDGGVDVVDRIFDKWKKYNSIITVENNACFTPGSLVLTRERGYVPIEEVKIGEHTWTHRARWRKITKLHKGRSKTITDATIAGSLPVHATPNHWFWMREVGRTPTRKGGHCRPVGDASWVSVGFSNKPSYVAIACPRWSKLKPVLVLPKTHRSPHKTKVVNEDFALMMGLFMAEGHTTRGQVMFTFGAKEDHLVQFTCEQLEALYPNKVARVVEGDGTKRVRFSSTQLANAFRTGTGKNKCLPLEWLGWPLEIRLAIVRGWLMGDGCLRTNNRASATPTKYFSGASISRNWIMWVRSTLLEAGYRPTISFSDSRKTSNFNGRTAHRSPIYTLRLCAADSFDLRQHMTTDVENQHWTSLHYDGRNNSPMVVDDDHAWAKLRKGPGTWRAHHDVVYNLEVEEDQSFTVEDCIVHNAQDFIRQWALKRNLSVPIKGITTGRTKAHPEHGIPGIFLGMMNGAWVIPNGTHGQKHPAVQRFIDACLYYTPAKHTDDVLMACYMAHQQKIDWLGHGGGEPVGGGGIGSVMDR